MKASSNFPELIETVLAELDEKYKNSSDPFFSDSDLLQLHSLFGDILDRALRILDDTKIILYRASKGLRDLIEIRGYQNHVYKLFPNINYCPCQSFKLQVLIHKTQYTCKHVLAVRIAQIFNKIQLESITDEQFNFLMKNILA